MTDAPPPDPPPRPPPPRPGTYGGTPYYSAVPYSSYPPSPATNGNAVIALVLGIVAVTGCGLAGIPALILGYKGRREIRASAGRESGEGLATAGVVLGWIGSLLMAAMVVFFLAILAIGLAVGGSSDDCTTYDADGNYREFDDC